MLIPQTIYRIIMKIKIMKIKIMKKEEVSKEI
jgi:hypothetical protein